MDVRTNSDYFVMQLDLFVFITEMESVYCAVRTGSLNIIQVKFPSLGCTMALAVRRRPVIPEGPGSIPRQYLFDLW